MSSRKMYVGIDVSNCTLDVTFLDGEARTARPQATYRNDPEGWVALRTAITAAASLLGSRVKVVCGMEATGNMHKRVEQALRGEKRRKLEVHVLNPRAVKNFARALLMDAKTDRSDSQVIALFLLRMQPTAAAPVPELFEEFREATRTRRRLVEERTDAKNRLHKMLRYHFPGYRSVVGKHLSKGLLVAINERPSPHLILDTKQGTIAAAAYGTRHRVGAPLEEKLRTLAAQAPQRTLPKLTQMLLRTTTRRILELGEIISEMDDGIAEMLEQLFPGQVLTSAPGLGAVSSASILAEVVDIDRFETKSNFVGYCGTYPIVWESGEAKRRYRMTSKGNRMLKMTLLVASAAARQYNPVIAAFYERLRARGKSTKAAGGAIARKLAELVYVMLVRNEPWSAEKAMAGLAKSREMTEARERKLMEARA
jgi:transposase